jgi:hypothetical protein
MIKKLIRIRYYLLVLVILFFSNSLILNNSSKNKKKFDQISDLSSDFLKANNKSYNKAKIFCIVITSQKRVLSKTPIVYDSWVNKCDGHKFVTIIPYIYKDQVTTDSFGAKEFKNQFEILQPPGLNYDTYGKLTDKMFITFKYIAKKYGKDYDWFLKADDDSFIFVDNLREFVNDKNSTDPITFGYNFNKFVKHGYHSGGGSYLLSKEAVQRLGSKLDLNYTSCFNNGIEDANVAMCLRQVDVKPGNSTDELGRERFHPLSLDHHYKGIFPDWLFSYASNPVKKVIYSLLTFFFFFYLANFYLIILGIGML